MRYTIQQVQEEVNKTDWKLLSIEYKNLKSELAFRCPEGHKVYTSYEKWRRKPECPTCDTNINKKISNISATPKKKGTYRTMALDQSSRLTGYSIYDNKELIAYGVFSADGATGVQRMISLCDWLSSMINSWKPDCVGLEETQYNNSAVGQKQVGHETFKLLSQVMGACMLTIARERVEVKTVIIPTWRHHCGVKGIKRTDCKRSAQLLVKKWYDISVTDDESDAICIGKYFSDNYKGNQVLIGEWI